MVILNKGGVVPYAIDWYEIHIESKKKQKVTGTKVSGQKLHSKPEWKGTIEGLIKFQPIGLNAAGSKVFKHTANYVYNGDYKISDDGSIEFDGYGVLEASVNLKAHSIGEQEYE